MKPLLFLIFFSSLAPVNARIKISGMVTDKKLAAISGANVYFEGSYDGATTGADGTFSFTTDLAGKQKLVASFVGYANYSADLDLDKDISVSIILEESFSEMSGVVINAGAFEASDEKKSVILKPFDIATTPSAQGDIFGALGALPGTEKVGESGKLFVRGGESYETKMYMDGMPVQSPFFSNIPDIPTRGRFSPLLFSGTVFSTGGYSAEYGQALSSVVALNTTDLEPKDKTSLALMSVGTSLSHVKRWENSSLALTGDYLNSILNNAIFKPRVDWLKPPSIADGNLMYRLKTGKTGMIKSFASYYRSSMAMNYDNIGMGRKDDIHLVNDNFYFNACYQGMVTDHWMLNAGLAYNDDLELTAMSGDKIRTLSTTKNAKVMLTGFQNNNLTIKIGSEFDHHRYRQDIRMNGNYNLPFYNDLTSAFAEAEWTVTKNFMARIGARTEYNSYLRRLNASPRVSAAYKTGRNSQVSVAYGTFHQNPEDDYLKFSPALSPENASHYIMNYQHSCNLRTFRLEAYVKEYSGLVKYKELYSGNPMDFSNTGFGHSRGIDLFWRDQSTFKNTDYWISYSFIESKRNYKDYPVTVTPDYVSTHNLSLVYKRFFKRLNTFVGFTYSYASPRPYEDPNIPDFMSEKTRPYHDISINVTYLTSVFKKQAVIHVMANNIFGFQNIYGYRFSATPDENGVYKSLPLESPLTRQVVLVFLVML